VSDLNGEDRYKRYQGYYPGVHLPHVGEVSTKFYLQSVWRTECVIFFSTVVGHLIHSTGHYLYNGFMFSCWLLSSLSANGSSSQNVYPTQTSVLIVNVMRQSNAKWAISTRNIVWLIKLEGKEFRHRADRHCIHHTYASDIYYIPWMFLGSPISCLVIPSVRERTLIQLSTKPISGLSCGLCTQHFVIRSHNSSDMLCLGETRLMCDVSEKAGARSVPGRIGRTPDVRSTMTPNGLLRCAKGDWQVTI